MRSLALLLVLVVPAAARKTQPVVLTAVFENQTWFPLPEKQMRAAAVDSALQELTGAGLIELSDEGNVLAGRLEAAVSLVERAESAKITLTFTALNVPSLVTTASVSLHGLDHGGIYNALVGVGADAGRKMKQRLLRASPADEVDRSLDQLLGKDWDNLDTEKLYSRAQDLKRGKQFAEARQLLLVVAQRRDQGSKQWRRLAQDELDYGLPLFQAQQQLMAAAEQRRKVDVDGVETLCRGVLEKNKGNEARVAEAQRCLDTAQQLRSAMGMVDRSELRSRARALQAAMINFYMENGRGPSLEMLKTMDPQLFSAAEVRGYAYDDKTGDYGFELVATRTQASATVKGNFLKGLNSDVRFK